MIIALSAGPLHTYGLDHAFGLAAEAGFQGLEVIIVRRHLRETFDFCQRHLEELP